MREVAISGKVYDMDVVKSSASVKPIPTKEISPEKDSRAPMAGDVKAKAIKEDLPLAVESGSKKEDDRVSCDIHAYGGFSFAVDEREASHTVVGGIDVDIFLARTSNYQFGMLTKIESIGSRKGSGYKHLDEDSGKYRIAEHAIGPNSKKVSVKRSDTSLRLGQAALMRMNFVDIPNFKMALDSSLGVFLDVELNGRDAGAMDVGLMLDVKVVLAHDSGLELFVSAGERFLPNSSVIGEINVIPFGIGYKFI